MTETAPPGAPASRPNPAPVALAVAHELVTRYRLRLVDPGDHRLGELSGAHELAAAAWTGRRAALVAFYRPPDDPEEAGHDLARRCESARRWGERRLAEQPAERCEILLIALGPVAGRVSAASAQGAVQVGAVQLDAERGLVEALIAVPRGLPGPAELRRHASAIRQGAEPPTLAAVDLAERQTVAGGYSAPVQRSVVFRPVATWSLIAVFVAIFLVEKLVIRHDTLGQPTSVGLLDMGALTNFSIPGHQLSDSWWRYVSSAFLHDDSQILHVAGNSLAMYFIGRLVEQLYGRLILLGVFLMSAVAGGIAWAAAGAAGLAHPGVSLGASGGIAGLMGLLILLGRVQGRDVPAGVATSIRQYVATYLVLSLLFALYIAGVNNFAHAGGFACGLLLSLVLPPLAQLGGRRLRSWERAALVTVIAAGALALVLAAGHLVDALAHPAARLAAVAWL